MRPVARNFGFAYVARLVNKAISSSRNDRGTEFHDKAEE